MHVLPQLRKLERAFHRELVVVGVHSPKFTNERSTENLRQAVLRLGIQHPTVSDPNMRTWSEYAVNAWPTLILVDPTGKLVGVHEGEFRSEEFQPIIADVLAEFDAKGLLDRTPMIFQPEVPPATRLLFPGKLLADVASDRLFIADSGHNRIVEATLDGKLIRTFGSTKGFADGSADEAAFDSPQGLALEGHKLYVADTENHSVRRIDLATGEVSTVAGTGEQARRVKDGRGIESALSSPWDLALHHGVLYIAMAGSHHIFALDLASRELNRYAGSGREALADAALARATFAQPSGLASDGVALYVADSETSAVRAVDLPGGNGMVRTLVGQGLFDFGDVDGVGGRVRLQHCLGVACSPPGPSGGDGPVFVADSYNHKIKQHDTRTRRTASLAGDGVARLVDGRGDSASFWEPGGLSAVPGKLYVADTNNHAVRVVDLATLEVTTLEIEGLEVPEDSASPHP